MTRRILIALAGVTCLAAIVHVGVKRAREAEERLAATPTAPRPPLAAPRPERTATADATPTPSVADPATAAPPADATPLPADAAADATAPAPLAAPPEQNARPGAPARDTRAPAPPLGLAATAVSPSSVSLEWSAASDETGVAGYRIARDGKALETLARGTVFSDEGLRPRSSHCYAVAAVDAAGNRSAWTRPACVETPDRAPPSAPPELRATATGERQVEISWGASVDDVGVASYEVVRAGGVVGRLRGQAVTESGLAPAQTYCYVVRALDAAGNASEPAGPACATTPDLTPPGPPDALVAEAEGERTVKARWHPAADDVGVAGYELLRDGKVVATTTDLGAAVRGLRPLVEVCLTARAFDAAGNRSAESAPACATTPDLTAPSVPRAVSLATPTERRAELRWAPSEDEIGVAGYEVERDGKPLATTAATELAEDGLRSGQEVCYAVRARDAAGNVSAPSRRACAVMPDLTPPSAPPRFAAAPSSPSNVAFAWEAATDNVGIAAYELRRPDGTVIARVDGRATRLSQAGLAPETEHCFALSAVDRAGNRSPSLDACATTPAPGVPSGPTVVRAEPKAQTMVLLKWDSSPDPDVVYAVYWDGGKKIGATSSTQYTVAGLRRGERRCYRVAAVDPASGKESPRTMETCLALGAAQ